MNENYYTTLGVERSASQKEIKTAFRKLAHKHHPDKGGDEKKFKEINAAYQTLSDEKKRAQYDSFGRVDGGFSGAGNANYQQYYSQFMNGNSNFGNSAINIKKIPLLGWIILLPFIVLLALVGFVIIIGFALRAFARGISR